MSNENKKRTWAVLAVTGIDDEPNTILAAGKDIIDHIDNYGDSDYLTIFPETPGVYLWRGTIDDDDDEVECEGEAQPISTMMELNRYIRQNKSAAAS